MLNTIYKTMFFLPRVIAIIIICWFFSCSLSDEDDKSENRSTRKDASITDIGSDSSTSLVCTPGERVGCPTYFDYKICNESGTGFQIKSCETGQICQNGICINVICYPGSFKCLDNKTLQKCSYDGSMWENYQTCDNNKGEVCVNNRCVNACAEAMNTKSYIGCEYWAVHLRNAPQELMGSNTIQASDTAIWGIAVSNTNTSLYAHVTVSEAATGKVLASNTIEPRKLQVFTFDPKKDNQKYNLKGTELANNKLLKITSDVPVVVYQFNPMNNTVKVYSNDASLLLPTHILTGNYIVASRQEIGYQHLNNGYLTIIATSPGTTTVDITPSANTAPGPGVPALTKGVKHTFTLSQYQILNIETASQGNDLTGTIIKANNPIAVFGGHVCENIPDSNGYCDHLEEQMFPVETWGDKFTAVHFAQRDYLTYKNNQCIEPKKGEWNPNSIYRIIAGKSNVQIRTIPPQPGFPITLNLGEFYEFQSNQDFVIEANGPIMAVQYMAGSTYQNPLFGNYDPCSHIGDPAMVLLVPQEQYRRDYIFLVPEDYATNWVNIAAPINTTITLSLQGTQNKTVIQPSQLIQIPGTQYGVYRFKALSGIYELNSNNPVSIIVYGYHQDVSFAYPGGLDLKIIYDNPQL
ncbi:MAG: IgGFc-binding protein [Deltaproteobacteria bacterium]|nr:IgGFc-binding protein [Deltaproteobacteria bacterium]